MRIIAGTLGGRQFDSPGSHRTHPMSDKMRGALFNILGDISGLEVLDAFGGSGALSFEAISRGATRVVVIDNDKTAGKTIARNVTSLGLKAQTKLIQASTNAWLDTNPETTFDIILCDPPYNELQPHLITRLSTRVKPEGLLILSYPGGHEPLALPGLTLIKQQQYGDAQLLFYRQLG